MRDPAKVKAKYKRYREKNKTKRAASARTWRENNPERVLQLQRDYVARRGAITDPEKIMRTKLVASAYQLLTTFGLTPEEWDQLYRYQNGKCRICQKVLRHRFSLDLAPDGKMASVDHDHKTGVIRGLVCAMPCNRRVIGNATLEEATALVTYLSDPPAYAVFGERVVPPKKRKKRKPAAKLGGTQGAANGSTRTVRRRTTGR